MKKPPHSRLWEVNFDDSLWNRNTRTRGMSLSDSGSFLSVLKYTQTGESVKFLPCSPWQALFLVKEMARWKEKEFPLKTLRCLPNKRGSRSRIGQVPEIKWGENQQSLVFYMKIPVCVGEVFTSCPPPLFWGGRKREKREESAWGKAL